MGEPFEIAHRHAFGGGDINQAELLSGRDGRRFFVKLNRAERLAMFEAEADGLSEMLATDAGRGPKPICSGIDDRQAGAPAQERGERPPAPAEAVARTTGCPRERAPGVTLYVEAALAVLRPPPPPRRVLLPAGTPRDGAERLRRDGWDTVAALDRGIDAIAEARRLRCSHVLDGDAPRALESVRE